MASRPFLEDKQTPLANKGNIRGGSQVSVIWQAEGLVGSCVIFQLVWDIGMTRLQILVQSWAFGQGPGIRTATRKAFGLTLEVDWGQQHQGELVFSGWAPSSVQRTIPMGTGPLVQLSLDFQGWDESAWGRRALCSLLSAEPETALLGLPVDGILAGKHLTIPLCPQTTQIHPPTFVTS